MKNPKLKRVAYLLVLAALFSWPSGAFCSSKEKKQAEQHDPFRALYLWSEKERERSQQEMSYRYYDYWAVRARLLSDYYSAYRQWLHLGLTEKWLQDPENNPLPPPPPIPPPPSCFLPPAPPWPPYLPYSYGPACWGISGPAPWQPWQPYPLDHRHIHHYRENRGGHKKR